MRQKTEAEELYNEIEYQKLVEQIRPNFELTKEELIKDLTELEENFRSESPKDYSNLDDKNLDIFSWDKAQEARIYNKNLTERIQRLKKKVAARFPVK